VTRNECGRQFRDVRSRTIRVAAAGTPLVNPKNGPKSCVAEKPVMYRHHPQFAGTVCRGGLDDFGAGPPVNSRPGQPGGEPVFQGEPAHFPELSGYRVPFALPQVAPVPGHLDGLLDVRVAELPADPVEARDLVAVDDVDACGAVLADQRGPLGAYPLASGQGRGKLAIFPGQGFGELFADVYALGLPEQSA
jgi:hypothetical protein